MCLCLLALKVDACASEHDILWTVRGGRTGCLGACVNVRKVAITDMFTYTHTTHTLQAYKQTNKQIHAYTHARTDNGTIQERLHGKAGMRHTYSENDFVMHYEQLMGRPPASCTQRHCSKLVQRCAQRAAKQRPGWSRSSAAAAPAAAEAHSQRSAR
jgi:hypothetical protein